MIWHHYVGAEVVVSQLHAFVDRIDDDPRDVTAEKMPWASLRSVHLPVEPDEGLSGG